MDKYLQQWLENNPAKKKELEAFDISLAKGNKKYEKRHYHYGCTDNDLSVFLLRYKKDALDGI